MPFDQCKNINQFMMFSNSRYLCESCENFIVFPSLNRYETISDALWCFCSFLHKFKTDSVFAFMLWFYWRFAGPRSCENIEKKPVHRKR
jgi:hypothetical protein